MLNNFLAAYFDQIVRSNFNQNVQIPKTYIPNCWFVEFSIRLKPLRFSALDKETQILRSDKMPFGHFYGDFYL